MTERKIIPLTLKIYSKGYFVFILLIFTSLAFAQEADEFYKEGLDYLGNKQYQEAAVSFEAALRLEPYNAYAKKQLSFSYASMAKQEVDERDWYEAIRFYKKALKYEPDNEMLQKNLAVCLANKAQDDFQTGRVNAAISSLKEAIKNDSQNVKFYETLAEVYYQNEDFKNAVKYLEDALGIAPESKQLKLKLKKITADAEVEKGYRKKRLGRFLVKYEGRQTSDFGKKALSILRKKHTRINWDLGHDPKDPITVILYTQEEYRDVAGYPDWSGGAYDGKIRVRLGDYLKGEEQLTKIITHEYTHAVIYQITKGNCPYWLNEGLAQFQEPGIFISKKEERLLKKLLEEDKLIALSFLNRKGFSGNLPAIKLSYIQSKSLTEYFMERFYLRRVKAVLKLLGEKKSIAEAIKSECDISLEDFEKDWKHWLKRQR